MAQVYSHNPLGAFILTFTASGRRSVHGIAIAQRPSHARSWAYFPAAQVSTWTSAPATADVAFYVVLYR